MPLKREKAELLVGRGGPSTTTMTPHLPLLLAIFLALLSLTTAIPTQQTARSSHETRPTATEPFVEATKTHMPREEEEGDDLSIPPYTAIVTAAPNNDAALASLGWYQTTYYECRTRGGEEHCGWHVPVRKSGALGRGDGRRDMVRMMGLAVVFSVLVGAMV